MVCLHCGDCCRRMSPLVTDPETMPCPHIVEARRGSAAFVFCGIYERRPQQCRDHSYLSSACPIGRWVLGIDDQSHLAAREHLAEQVLEDMGPSKTLQREKEGRDE